MFIAPHRHRSDVVLMVDDLLRPIVARVETQPLRAWSHWMRIAIAGVMADSEVHKKRLKQ
jgi:hypothetical protein